MPPKQSEVVSSNPPVVVIGAGPTGLSAAYHLGGEALLLERQATVGGWCRSIEDHGFTFDLAGHIMFSTDPYVHQLYEILLGDNVHWQDREAWIWSKGVYTRYPFQGSLYGLPPEVIRECIMGAIDARYGTKLQATYTGPERRGRIDIAFKSNAANRNGTRGGWTGADRRTTHSNSPADGRGNGHSNGAGGRAGEPGNFEEFIYRVWGAGIAKHFAIPYNRKLWAVPLDEMETSWLGGRVPLPDLEQIIEGALSPSQKPMGPNARFGYPLRGGFQALMDGFLPHLKGELRLDTSVVAVAPREHRLRLQDGSEVGYECLVSTMPLPTLVRLMDGQAPPQVRAAAAALRHVSVRCVNLGIGRERITEKHWIYYPEDSVFHRVFVQGNASPHCNPPGGFGLTCEITYGPSKPLPCEGDALIQRCIADVKRAGLIRDDDEIWAANQVDLPVAYVVYDHARAANVQLIRDWMLTQNIILAGRYAEWEYYNSDHAFIAGKKAAEQVLELRLTPEPTPVVPAPARA